MIDYDSSLVIVLVLAAYRNYYRNALDPVIGKAKD